MAEMQSRPPGRGSTPPGPLAAGANAGGLRPGGRAKRDPLERPGAWQGHHAQDLASTREVLNCSPSDCCWTWDPDLR